MLTIMWSPTGFAVVTVLEMLHFGGTPSTNSEQLSAHSTFHDVLLHSGTARNPQLFHSQLISPNSRLNPPGGFPPPSLKSRSRMEILPRRLREISGNQHIMSSWSVADAGLKSQLIISCSDSTAGRGCWVARNQEPLAVDKGSCCQESSPIGLSVSDRWRLGTGRAQCALPLSSSCHHCVHQIQFLTRASFHSATFLDFLLRDIAFFLSCSDHRLR
jgi:hypothetical protein